MLSRRLIACLDVRDGSVVKGVRFEQLRHAGDPAALARRYNDEGADEIVVLDVSATIEGRRALADTIRAVAREVFIPLAVGGGIRGRSDAVAVFDAGADKVCVNTAAVEDPSLITALAERYGSQAVVVAIDAKRSRAGLTTGPSSGFEAVVRSGREPTGRDAVEWAREAVERGAGELLVTSMDRDGTREGFDCDLTAAVAEAVPIPVIASGGAGQPEHFADVFTLGRADAALAASIFHYSERSLADLKTFLGSRGIPVRQHPWR
ncbi:MAG TPA: imidazole glycerol phosphate synthase subunit HisF [Vicinamibacterales bacterium]|jgi:cyclase|nr:imidazole glycerol phosphate synthase subunit HisF [Vicinamibacterales bacterium]